ncbi:hypothetical protein SKAU_G00268590 [Synaphobranchus kaupii]|uniref:Uncharacterized protein n=1 Tax=Synaphobranchus kaupii TaxID=118154 RepID=A0A9Q1IPF7_SYNKA|nr:hypothetical protein SKAU_G00268590 [Synaphobranchus kaupii]
MDLQKFGVNIYLIQVIFGAVDIPAKLVAMASLSFLGRRISQSACLILSATFIFTNIFVPSGEMGKVLLQQAGNHLESPAAQQ